MTKELIAGQIARLTDYLEREEYRASLTTMDEATFHARYIRLMAEGRIGRARQFKADYDQRTDRRTE